MSLAAFWNYVKGAQLRTYQERNLVLDLCHTGWSGWLLAALLVAVMVVFLLSIFHLIPARRHVTGLLLGIGLAAALLGFAASFYHAGQLPAAEAKLFRDTSGPMPVNDAQKAAVVALPMMVGATTLLIGASGCVYMAMFWATSRAAKT